MLSHAMLGSNDMARAAPFYDKVLGLLGARQLMKFRETIVWGVDRPALGVGYPYDGKEASVGNGTMVALIAPTRAVVDEVHATALALGAADEGAPGIRGGDASDFYGAYFRDLDGNKICVYRSGP